ncbi:MAG: PP2C family protein-serine/threonine phosphatase [Anaerolineae bacterium]
MHIQVGVAKVPKYATSESGDTLEMVERPHGGLSLVLADGQRSGRSAKSISTMVAHKAVALLADGVRDGAAARAAHDYLYTQRGGKVSATLNIISIDMVTKTLVISRNSHCPVVVHHADGSQILLDTGTDPVGVHRMTKPDITELPLRAGTLVVVFTDGLISAGRRTLESLDVAALVTQLYAAHQGEPGFAQAVAAGLLEAALKLDDGRPVDDTSVVAVAVAAAELDLVRRMQVQLPIPPLDRPG